MDNRCLGDVCKSLETQPPEKAAECVKSRTVNENIDGCKIFPRLLRSRDSASLKNSKGLAADLIIAT